MFRTLPKDRATNHQRTFPPLPAIRVIPAMEAGISDHVWTLRELLMA
jgi:hypothetical protein